MPKSLPLFPARSGLSTLFWGVTFLLVAAIVTSANPAAAQVRVAVVSFQGSGSTGARRQVDRALSSDSRVASVDLDRVDSAAGRTGAGASGETGIAALATELEARMVIQGAISGRGRRKRFELTARDMEGRVVGSVDGRMRGRALVSAVSRLLDEAIPRLPAPRAVVAEPPPILATADPIEDPEYSEGGGSEDPDDPTDATWEDRAPLLALTVGIVPRTRDADVTLADTTHRRYASGFYPELAVGAELRPLSSEGDILGGIYGHVEFAHSVGLGSRNELDDTTVETNFFNLGFGVGLLVPVAEIFELGGEIGAGWDVYNLGANPVLTSAEYIYIRPAVRGRLRIFHEMVVIDAQVGFRPVVSRGDIAATFGPDGDTFGLDVGAGLTGSYQLADPIGITWALRFTWVNYWHSFSGTGAPAPGQSGTDGGIRLAINLGLAVW